MHNPLYNFVYVLVLLQLVIFILSFRLTCLETSSLALGWVALAAASSPPQTATQAADTKSNPVRHTKDAIATLIKILNGETVTPA